MRGSRREEGGGRREEGGGRRRDKRRSSCKIHMGNLYFRVWLPWLLKGSKAGE